MSSIGLTLSFQQVHKLSRYFSFFRPLPLLPSTFPVTARFSRPCRLMTRPSKFIINITNNDTVYREGLM